MDDESPTEHDLVKEDNVYRCTNCGIVEKEPGDFTIFKCQSTDDETEDS